MSGRSILFSSVIIIPLLLSVTDEARAKEAACAVSPGIATIHASNLSDGFASPPLSARPAVYWVWVNGLTNKQQLTYELQQMRAKGLGGVYIFDVGAHDPKGIVPEGPAFMGPESLKAIGHAVREAGRLGLDVGLVTSSSWNCGGPWVTPEHASMGLFHCQVTLNGPAQFSDTWRHWQDGPFDLKGLADRALCGGANHFTFHTCAHNPPGAGLPGWVYHAGTYISPTLVWWPKAALCDLQLAIPLSTRYWLAFERELITIPDGACLA